MASSVLEQRGCQQPLRATLHANAAGVIFFGFMINALGELLQHAGQTARRATLLHNKIQVKYRNINWIAAAT